MEIELMYKCNECEKQFTSYRGLNGHKRLHGVSQGSYASRPKAPITYFNCLLCDTQKAFKVGSSYGKYCSMRCQIDHKWEHIGRVKVLAGNGGNLRRFLTEEYGYKCSECTLSEWRDGKLVLHVDHIDGNSDNNDVTNIRFLCPNCHSQTPTFCGRNTKNTKRNSYLRKYKSENKQIKTSSKMVVPVGIGPTASSM